jgi:hypothetical protein
MPNSENMPAFGEWQPIESAPRDGSEFLAIFNRSKIVISCWSAEGFRWSDPKAMPRWPGTCLRTLFKVWPRHETDVRTSFWMPLPPPPSEGVE